MLVYARTLSKASYLSTLSIFPTVLRFCRSIHIPAVVVSKDPHTYLRTYRQLAKNSMAKCIHPNTALKN